MLLTPALVLALSSAAPTLEAAPTSAVAVTRRVGLDARRATDLADRLGSAIAAQKPERLGVVLDAESFLDRAKAAKAKDPVTCGGNTPCAVGIGKSAGVQYLVALQLVAVGTSLAIDGRVLEVAEGAVLATVTATLPSSPGDAELGELAKKMLSQLKPLEPVKVVERPPEPLKVPDVTPPPPDDRPLAAVEPKLVPPPAVVVARPVPVSGTPAAIGLGIGAVAAAGVGVGLLFASRSRAAAINPASPDASRDRTIANGIAMGANLGFAAAGVLLTGAVAAWLMTPETVAAPGLSATPPPPPPPAERDVATFD